MRPIIFLVLIFNFLQIYGYLKPDSMSIYNTLWENHVKEYQLEFPKSEESRRRDIFIENLKRINEHNKREDKTFSLGMNRFGHLTHDEILDYLKRSSIEVKRPQKKVERDLSPKCNLVEIDWRSKGKVTPVQNQGQCGSCWAFSATGSLEGQYAIKYNKLLKLSEQDLVDCSYITYGNHGCSGGLVIKAYRYVRDKGINLAQSYPYRAKLGTCKHDSSKTVLRVEEPVYVEYKNEDDLCSKIQSAGPISVAIDASDYKFLFYKDGIYSKGNCSQTSLNHDLLAVGFGSSPSKYYILKNSWGERWGNKGYVKFGAFEDNQCGIATDALYPIIRAV